MKHVLDRPVWSALTTRHTELAEGSNLARRYDPSITPFAAARDDSEECLHALAELAGRNERLLLVHADEIVLPPGFSAEISARAVQMVPTRPLEKVADERLERLGDADAADMLALAKLTKPGPFSLKAQSLGEFWGVKVNGALVAMAGERMKQDGYTELSGVCSHPDVRGRGLARLLSLFVAGRIIARGELPYLHAYATNAAAIALYESIGFEVRRVMNVALLRREPENRGRTTDNGEAVTLRPV
jgi:predicted GNAT family acetyltransferase